MKKIIAILTAAFISASFYGSFAAAAETPEVEQPTCTEPAAPCEPLYHQFRFDTPAALAAQLNSGFSDEVMSVLGERDGGVFEKFVAGSRAAGLAVPMYGGRDIPFTHVSLFSKDLYGLPAVYYGVGNEVISHIIVQYPYDLTKSQPCIPVSTADAVKALYAKSDYAGFDTLEKADMQVCGSTDAVIERVSGDTRTYVTFLSSGVLVCAVLNTDDLSVLSDLSMDMRKLMKSDVSGDADNNGELTIADAVVFQRWLMGRGHIEDPAVMDLHKDDRIDVYDLVVLKQILVAEWFGDVFVDPVAPPESAAPATTAPAEPTSKEIINVRSLSEYKAQYEYLDSTDEEFSAAHHNISRTELSETLDIMESLPIPVIDGAEVTWICRSVDPNSGSDAAYITLMLTGGEFVRLEYILSEKNPEHAINSVIESSSDVLRINRYVGDPDEDVKVYGELRSSKTDGYTDVTWFVKYKFDLYVRAVYHSADPIEFDTEALLGSVRITTLKQII